MNDANKKQETDLQREECIFNYTREYDLCKNKDVNSIALLGRALSLPLRIEILQELNVKPMSLTDIARRFNIHASSAAVHLRILQDASLVFTQDSTIKKGVKYYSYPLEKNIIIHLRNEFGISNELKPYVKNIAIGEYVNAEFGDTCGFASETTMLNDGIKNLVFAENRKEAQILWTSDGFVEYAFPNVYALNKKIDQVEINLEICSEARGYNEDYVSDISFFINDKRLCVFQCPGDYGKRYGKYTPSWWYNESTKYGLLTTISITDKGILLNGKTVNNSIKLKDLKLDEGLATRFKIAIEKDAVHKGGFNLFGEKFGDYNIPIVFTAYYK
ncbi:MAG: ArsR/SmtB family transcription factor [Candidatus Fimimonas sp.]